MLSSGSLKIRIGPMFSGKSTWLNLELTKFADQGKNVLKIIHDTDHRHDVAHSDSSGSTHNTTFTCLSPKITCLSSSFLNSIDVSDFDIIGVDEAQFFPDLLSTIIFWIDSLNKQLFVVGLDGDINRKPFGSILNLIPYADNVKKLNAVCRICIDHNINFNSLYLVAPFTKYTSSFSFNNTSQDTSSSNLIDIGGSTKYQPVCRYHYLR